MSRHYFLSLAMIAAIAFSKLKAQELPVKIDVSQLTADPNQQFGVLHFSAVGKDQFSILYYQYLNGTVAAPGELIRDTGSVAYLDRKDMNDMKGIPYSDNAMLLVKQTFGKDGQGSIEKTWLLAKRQLASADNFKIYFRKGFKHPLVSSYTPITLTVHNLSNINGLSQAEQDALTMLVKREFLPDPAYIAQYQQTSLADDIMKIKSDFKSLKRSGLLFKGDLPKSEDVLSRFSITKDKSMVITKLKDKDKNKKNAFTLKFYLTSDWQTFDVIDSTLLQGSLDLTSVALVYTENAEIAGANANFVLKEKDEKGEDVAHVLTYLLNENNDLMMWKHSVGKNKLSSFQPQICWYRNGDLMILGTNGEKFFKPAYQLHQFSKGKDAVCLYPTSEEEKGSEKFKYVKTFQPEGPVGTTTPLPEKHIPVLFYNINGTQYIISEGYKKDPNTHSDQYLPLVMYRITADNKITDINDLNSYLNAVPAKIDFLIKTPDKVYLMPYYQNKFQMTLDKDQMTLSPIDTPTSRLIPLINGDFLVRSSAGAVLLSRAVMGTKYTLLFYPEQ